MAHGTIWRQPQRFNPRGKFAQCCLTAHDQATRFLQWPAETNGNRTRTISAVGYFPTGDIRAFDANDLARAFSAESHFRQFALQYSDRNVRHLPEKPGFDTGVNASFCAEEKFACS